MKGIGGPLLCIGDLLSDVGEDSQEAEPVSSPSASPSPSSSSSSSTDLVSGFDPQSVDLTKLFQENYERLNEALAGSDHSWTSLTLNLCSALETANKLVQSTNSNVVSLSEKVAELERIVKRADSAVDAAKAARTILNRKAGTMIADRSTQQSRMPH